MDAYKRFINIKSNGTDYVQNQKKKMHFNRVTKMLIINGLNNVKTKQNFQNKNNNINPMLNIYYK